MDWIFIVLTIFAYSVIWIALIITAKNIESLTEIVKAMEIWIDDLEHQINDLEYRIKEVERAIEEDM